MEEKVRSRSERKSHWSHSCMNINQFFQVTTGTLVVEKAEKPKVYDHIDSTVVLVTLEAAMAE